jgi:hypothetical protein
VLNLRGDVQVQRFLLGLLTVLFLVFPARKF